MNELLLVDGLLMTTFYFIYLLHTNSQRLQIQQYEVLTEDFQKQIVQVSATV